MSDWTFAFPRLREGAWQKTSEATAAYNCVAWAAGEDDRWWWLIGAPDAYWPAAAPSAETLSAFEQAFATLGYERSDVDGFEDGYEYVALFANAEGIPTHVARRLADGRWSSKLGRSLDIAHALADLEGDLYGEVSVILCRPTPRP